MEYGKRKKHTQLRSLAPYLGWGIFAAYGAQNAGAAKQFRAGFTAWRGSLLWQRTQKTAADLFIASLAIFPSDVYNKSKYMGGKGSL